VPAAEELEELLLIPDPAICDVPLSGGFDSRDIDSFIGALQPLESPIGDP
jgi:ferric-dicitrate binding protein FerR (iron transport regulator)